LKVCLLKFKLVYCHSFIYTVYKNKMVFLTDQGANTKEKYHTEIQKDRNLCINIVF